VKVLFNGKVLYCALDSEDKVWNYKLLRVQEIIEAVRSKKEFNDNGNYC
jgi:hypothetical protein